MTGTKRFIKLAAVVVGLSTVLSACTFTSGNQAEIDVLPTRYRLYIYQKPTGQLLLLRNICALSEPAREATGRCTLTWMRNNVELEGLGMVTAPDWNNMTKGSKWGDIMGAFDSIIAGGTATDGSGEAYANRCLVNDHVFFGAYNWTYRVASDSRCKRGQLATNQ